MSADRKRREPIGIRTGSAIPLLMAAAVAASVAVAPALAENDPASAGRFLVQNATRGSAAPATTPPDSRPRPGPFGFRSAARSIDRTPRAGTVAVAKAATAPAPPHVVVAVYGDRVGQALAAGLQILEGDGATVQALADEEAGLSRPSFQNWLQSIRDRLAKPDHAGVAVIAIGTNDRQPMQGDTGALEPSSPQWQALYGSRVDATIRAFQDARVPVIWVGLPAVRSEEASADYVRLNGIVRDHALRDGATYVDSYGAFTDDSGRYTPTGPDLDGSTVKLRRADGNGFTHAGERKLASFIEGDINRLTRHPASDAALASLTIDKARNFDSALQIDVNAQIRREAALAPTGPDATASLRHEPPAAAAAPSPAGPAAGPVLPLTAAPVTPGGQLAALGAPDAAAAVAVGVPTPDPAPKPGRADDFSWPKP